MERTLHSLDELQAEAASFVSSLAPKQDRATLVTLSGELGAGKTAFTQGLARALGVMEPVTSPTFVLLKVYELPHAALFQRLVHVDAYRLHGGKELAPLELDSYFQDPLNLVVLEWPEQVIDKLPSPDVAIQLSVAPDNGRIILYG